MVDAAQLTRWLEKLRKGTLTEQDLQGSRTPGAVGQGPVGEGRWQGQDAGGTPALPGDAVRLGGGRAPDG